MAAFDIRADRSGFLPLHLPDGAEIVWAEVDEEPVSALHSKTAWEIPIADRRARRVRVVWMDPTASSLNKLQLPVPESGRAPLPALVRLRARPGSVSRSTMLGGNALRWSRGMSKDLCSRRVGSSSG